MKPCMRKSRQRGFTLMELMITMVIIGVLTAIAIPNYTAYIQRSNRGEARNQLLEASTWTERFRTEQGRYDLQAAVGTQNLPVALQCVPRNTTGYGTCRNYEVRFEFVTVSTYRLNALRQAGGQMAADVCATLRVDQSGLRDFTGVGPTQEVCWDR
jgi:type IV pilus assembly protein PilE